MGSKSKSYCHNVFILHSLNGDTLKFWGEDVKETVEDYNVKVIMPEFPIRSESTFEKFENILNEYLKNGQLNENTIIIAHSIGNAYFTRFAKKYNFIPKAFISVAPGAVYADEVVTRNDYIVEVKKQAYVSREDLKFVKSNIKNKFCIYSDEDNKKSDYFKRFIEDTNAKDIYLKGYHHFDGYHRIYKIPELIEILESLIK